MSRQQIARGLSSCDVRVPFFDRACAYLDLDQVSRRRRHPVLRRPRQPNAPPLEAQEDHDEGHPQHTAQWRGGAGFFAPCGTVCVVMCVGGAAAQREKASPAAERSPGQRVVSFYIDGCIFLHRWLYLFISRGMTTTNDKLFRPRRGRARRREPGRPQPKAKGDPRRRQQRARTSIPLERWPQRRPPLTLLGGAGLFLLLRLPASPLSISDYVTSAFISSSHV